MHPRTKTPHLRSTTKKTGRQIAKEFPGYSQNNDDLRDTGAKEEVAALQEDLKSEGKDIKSINLCKRLGEHLGASKDTIKIDEGKGGAGKGTKEKLTSKITATDIHKYNHSLVHSTLSPERQCLSLIRHNRIQQMMDKGDLNDDNALSYHLRFFDVDRQQQLENVDRAARSKVELDDKYDNEFME